jgi:hypothetical protein
VIALGYKGEVKRYFLDYHLLNGAKYQSGDWQTQVLIDKPKTGWLPGRYRAECDRRAGETPGIMAQR